MLRWTNISPGSAPVSASAGTRLSEHPMKRECGSCLPARFVKNCGSVSVMAATQRRLFASSRWSFSLSARREPTGEGGATYEGAPLAGEGTTPYNRGARLKLLGGLARGQ